MDPTRLTDLFTDPQEMSLAFPTFQKLQRMTRPELIAQAIAESIPTDLGSQTKADIVRAILQHRTEKAERELAAKEAAELAARNARNTQIRRQLQTPDLRALREPLSYLAEYGGPREITQHVPGQTFPSTAEMDEFPNSVAEYLWVHEGEHDGESWLAIGHLACGKWFFFKAYCDYTGFDCQGDMKLYIVGEFADLIQMALGNSDYDLWIEQTAPAAEL